jgi:hypothetical protein
MSFHCFSSILKEKLMGGFTLPLFETSVDKLSILKLQGGKLPILKLWGSN